MVINFFLFLEVFLLFCGLALDAGMLEWRTLQLQNAADAAAQEGMYELARGNTSWSTAGSTQSANNGFTNGANGVTVTLSNPPGSGFFATDTLAVQASVATTANNFFMEFVGASTSNLVRQAVARIIPTCVWILDPTASGNGTFWLQSSSVRTVNCGVYVNTASGSNLQVDGFSTLSSIRNRVTGPSTSNTSTGTVTPQTKFGAATKLDPLAYVTAPTFSSCTYSNMTINTGTYTVYPGTYCNLSVSNANITFSPGLYLIVGGMTINTCTISGSGVTVYFTKGGTYTTYGNINITGSTLSLSAPTTSSGGGIPGILFFADRAWIDHGNKDIAATNSTITGDGIWYIPNVGLNLSGSNTSVPNYMGLVVDSYYQYLGTVRPAANYTTLSGGSPIHYDDGFLVQ